MYVGSGGRLYVDSMDILDGILESKTRFDRAFNNSKNRLI